VVVGKQSFALTAAPSLEDPQRIEVGYKSGGTTVLLGSSTLQGGNLGGLLAFRAEALDSAQNSLGLVAIGVAQSINSQNRLGQDLNGALGGAVFTVASPGVLPRSDNSGTATVSASFQDVSALTTSDYKLVYTGASAGNENFVLTRLSDGAATAINFPTLGGYPHSAVVDGVKLTIASGAAVNDSWAIQPTRTGARDISLVLSDPAAIAAASPIRTGAGQMNQGNGTIATGSVTSVASLPLPGTITLTYSAATGTFSVSGAAPAVAPFAYTSGASVNFNGVGIAISGAPADGDTFTISRNSGGVSDNSNAVALASLQTASTLGKNASIAGSQPVLSFQQAYAQMVSQVGNKTRQTEVMSTAQQNLVAQTTQAQQSLSGVNLDEEAANLLRYQQSYQASGKMMQLATTLFQTLLDISK
jgi:flagellar hook-associated protein 1 FlgK